MEDRVVWEKDNPIFLAPICILLYGGHLGIVCQSTLQLEKPQEQIHSFLPMPRAILTTWNFQGTRERVPAAWDVVTGYQQ